jgi:hypothetical protein
MSSHIDARHHAVILVFEVVAVQQVTPAAAAPPDDHVNLLSVLDRDGILPSRFLSPWRAAVAPQDLERRKVRMHGVQSLWTIS